MGINATDPATSSRLKLILADGRRLYATHRGRIKLIPSGESAAFDDVFRKNRSAADPLVYTGDLREFGRRSALRRDPAGVLAILAIRPEPADLPLDPTAFVIGGKPAVNL